MAGKGAKPGVKPSSARVEREEALRAYDDYAALIGDRERLIQENAELNRMLARREAEIKRLNEKRTSGGASVASRIKSLEDSYSVRIASLNTDIDSLRAQIEAKERAIENLNTKIASLTEEIDSLSAEKAAEGEKASKSKRLGLGLGIPAAVLTVVGIAGAVYHATADQGPRTTDPNNETPPEVIVEQPAFPEGTNFDFTAEQNESISNLLKDKKLITASTSITGLKEVVSTSSDARSLTEGSTILYFETEEDGVKGVVSVEINTPCAALVTITELSLDENENFGIAFVETALSNMAERQSAIKYWNLESLADALGTEYLNIVDKVAAAMGDNGNGISQEDTYIRVIDRKNITANSNSGRVNMLVFDEESGGVYLFENFATYQTDRGYAISKAEVPGAMNGSKDVEFKGEVIFGGNPPKVYTGLGVTELKAETEANANYGANGSVVKDDGMIL